jgi:hypothetical protein
MVAEDLEVQVAHLLLLIEAVAAEVLDQEDLVMPVDLAWLC